MKHRLIIASLVLALALGGFITSQSATVSAQDGGVVNLYSARHYGAIEEPFQAFTDATGIEVRVSQGSPRELLERLRAEGDRTPADILLVIDAGVLSLAAEEGLLQAVESDVLLENIDETQRAPDNRWFGLSQRVRTIMINPDNVSDEERAALTTYADLADPMWAGRLCMRPASHIYQVSLFSSLIFHLGEDEARSIVEGIVANDPIYIDSDTRQLEAVAAGECDVAVTNHYYLGRLLNENPDFNVEPIWANQDTTGTFYNINGAGVTAGAQNVEEAIAFIEWLSSLEGQSGEPTGFPGSNFEYPTNFNAEPNEIIAQWEFDLDLSYSLWEYGALQTPAVELLEAAGFGFSEN